MTTAIADRVTLHPTVQDREPAFLADMVERVEEWLKGVLNMPEGVRRRKGFSVSDENASEDISGLAGNEFYVSADGRDVRLVTLTLAGLTTGTAIAAALQTAIRAVDDGSGYFEDVTVVFSSTTKQYTIESSRYGREASIELGYEPGKQQVLRALKLMPEFGGTEGCGAFDHAGAQALAVELATQWFRQAQLQGASERTPSKGEIEKFAKDEKVQSAIESLRRL